MDEKQMTTMTAGYCSVRKLRTNANENAMVIEMTFLHVHVGMESKFEEQLPDSVDVMVRSLRAGHPLPVAIAMVSREMPDPIGSEFGLTADEMTYGLDLETAMNNMSQRVGLDDLTLVVIKVTTEV